MKKTFLILLSSFLLFSIACKSQIKERSLNNNFIYLWQNATIKNLNYQLTLLHSHKKNNFFHSIINTEKKFIYTQSVKNGLRNSFLNEILKHSKFLSEGNSLYIIEQYKTGEKFTAKVSLYIFGNNNLKCIYNLASGKWNLLNCITLNSREMDSIFNKINVNFCDKYYTDESIIITKFEKSKVNSKALLFPCSEDFKKLNAIAFQ